MTDPIVSVVMPVRNAMRTIERAVSSIRRQTLPGWEMIAVDDGSQDATALLLDKAARTDSRIRVVRIPHGGITAALNEGISLANGRFIARMDADDISSPERLESQVRFLDAHMEVGVAGSLVAFGGDRRESAGFALHVDWLNTLVSHTQILLNRFVESPFAHPSVMFRHDLVAKHGGYLHGDFPEDYELWLRWLDAGVVMAKVPRVLLTWTDSATRLSRTNPRYRPAAFYRCKAAYLSRWLRGHVDDNRKILIWGAGRPTRQRADFLTAHGIEIEGYIDIDPRKQGRVLRGRRIIAPDDLPPPEEVFVLGYVSKRGARDLIRRSLVAKRFVEGQDFLMAA